MQQRRRTDLDQQRSVEASTAGASLDVPGSLDVDDGESAATARQEDDALLLAIQMRDSEALAAFYDRYGRMAFGLAYRLLGERGIAEDVVQEAFLNVWRRAASFEVGRGSARSWLMSIVHNLAIDRRRGRQRYSWTDVALDDVEGTLETDADDAFALVAQSIEAERVQSALLSLPEEQRETITMAYFSGLTQQEIAERTGSPLGTVKSRMRLGLRRLRSVLGDDLREVPA